MNVVILYPAVRNVPIGGLKVVYDYANRLARDGCHINIVYASHFPNNGNRFWRSFLKYLYQIIWRKLKGCRWYELHPLIEEKFVWEYNESNVPKADAIIATAVTTAKYAANLSGYGKRFYFIQDFEDFIASSESYVYSSYKLPLEKIVISNWLKTVVETHSGMPCHLIVNGFDRKKYYVTIPVEKKKRKVISLLYHTRPAKDVNTAFKALLLVKSKVPDFEVNMFGVYNAPDGLPSWIHYIQDPTAEQHLLINNESAIYLGSSLMEGWGLTVGEAMMCGQAVVCTDNKGYLEMAKDGYNALVAPAGDAKSLAAHIVRLINDDDLRIKIARNGIDSIKQFDIEESYRKFKKVLEK